MANRSDPYDSSLPAAVRRVAGAFRITGWISFWIQIVLAVVSTIVLLFTGSSLTFSNATARTTATTRPETGFGLFFAVCGLVVLFAGAYWAFRYTRMARRLKNADVQRPKRGDFLQALQIGLAINLGGILLTVLGAQAIVGALAAKSFAQVGGIFTGNLQNFINPLDILLVQANINIIMAHFIGAVATLWLLRSMSRQ